MRHAERKRIESPAGQQGDDDSEGMFRDLCENASDLIQSITPEGRFVYVNRAWLTTLGYTPADLQRLSIFDVIHPDSRDHCEAIMKDVMSGRTVREIKADFQTKEGERVRLEGSASARMRSGKPVATVGIFRDVTRRSLAEEQLSRLFDLSMDFLCVAGLDGFFKQINPAFERILKYSREELLSRSFIEFVHPDDRAKTLEEVDHLAKGLLTVDFQNRYRDRDGVYHWLQWRATPFVEKGQIYATARDITDQVRIQEELARSNADLEQFAYAASHDLRAPLRGIVNLSEWIEEDMPGGLPEKVKEHLKNLRERAHRMEALTDDLLRYSRVGRVADEVTEVDTAALVEDVASLLELPEGFVLGIEEPLPRFLTHKAPLEQVFRNLIGNAIKHHDRKEGVIEVRVSELGPKVFEFSVTDDGPGISPEYRRKIFDMFHQLRPRDEIGGTGMGLALVRRIVETHGGRILVEANPERGSTFRFTWPRKIEETEHAGDPDR